LHYVNSAKNLENNLSKHSTGIMNQRVEKKQMQVNLFPLLGFMLLRQKGYVSLSAARKETTG
jgi:hypothetical protein